MLQVSDLKPDRKPDQCAAKRCRQTTDLTAFYRPPEINGVMLCQRHYAKADAPEELTGEVVSTEPTGAIQTVNAVPTDVTELSAEAVGYLSGSREGLAVITSQEELELAAEVLAAVKGIAKRIDARRKEATDPLNASLKAIRGWFAPAMDACETAERELKAKIAAYHHGLEAARTTAMAQITAEASSGTVETALTVLSQSVEPEKVKGLSTREIERFEVTDVNLLPVEYTLRVPDLEHIGKAVAAGVTIPGVRTWKEIVVASRSM